MIFINSRYLLSWGKAYFSLTTLNDIVCKICQLLNVSFEIFSDYAMVAMMIERCFVVFFPLHAKAIMNFRFSFILLCICTFTFWVSVAPIIPFGVGLQNLGTLTPNGIICSNYYDGLNTYLLWSKTLILYFIHVIASLILVVVLVTKLFVNLRRRRRLFSLQEGSGSEQRGKEYSAIVVMILISSINIISFIPVCITTYISYTVDTSKWSQDAQAKFNNIYLFTLDLRCVSHSINFIVYFCRIPSFRNGLLKLFSCCITN